jgi:DNA replication licensing factor MCM3
MAFCAQNDRVAIHEVMEQQTVTIAKAGIHAALNARCSVIAAANPIYGQYDKSRRPQENIGLPDSLLSRFDLLFIVLDQLDPALDRRLSEHVIRSHQYRRPGTVMEPEPLNQQSTLNLDDSNDNNTPVDTPVWLRSGNSYTDVSARRGSNDVLTKDFLRKYIHFAKRIQPVLSEEAIDRISSAYATMRAQQSRKNLPITARTLETVIRLSTAAAKIRLSQSVEVEDVETAIELLNFVLFHEIGSQESKAQHVDSVNSSSTANAEDDATSTEGEEIELDESNMGTESTVDQSLLQAAVKVIATQRQIDTISIAEFAVLLKENSSARFDHSELTSVLQNLEQSNHVSFAVFPFSLNLTPFISRSCLMISRSS